MGYGPTQKFKVDIASGATLSNQADLGRGWGRISLEIPTMASGTDLFIQAANSTSGTFRRYHHRLTSALDTPAAMNVNSSITNCLLPLEFVNAQYLKVELSTAMTATSASFNFICH